MKAHFITPFREFACVPYIKKGKWDKKNWITLSDLVVRLPDNSLLIIPAGFVTNFGSIPRALRGCLNPMGASLRAFVVHDWLYSKGKGKWKQRQCDEFLYDLGREDGEGWWAAQSINKGLAIGGWACYKKSPAKMEKVSESTLRYIAHCNGYKLEKTEVI